MSETRFETIDLNFQNVPGTVATYLVCGPGQAVLIDTGPGSTIPALEAALAQRGLTAAAITDVLLTHIHLDHAGAAGWLARQGAMVHVHPKGAPHLLDPDKLIASATRIYGGDMERLWGAFLPVPAGRLHVLADGEIVKLGELEFTVLETPGHADHHIAYRMGDVVFCGDVGGVRMQGARHIRIPMPPPEINLDKWRASLRRLRETGARTIALGHFGPYEDVMGHLDGLERALDEADIWLAREMSGGPAPETFAADVVRWYQERARAEGVTDPTLLQAYEVAAPGWAAIEGLRRYWNRVRLPAAA